MANPNYGGGESTRYSSSIPISSRHSFSRTPISTPPSRLHQSSDEGRKTLVAGERGSKGILANASSSSSSGRKHVAEDNHRKSVVFASTIESQRVQPKYLPLQKNVKFAVPTTERIQHQGSDAYIFRSRSASTLDDEGNNFNEFQLRDKRRLPNAPFNKHPLSPTIPVAKLKLYKDIFGSGSMTPQRGQRCLPPLRSDSRATTSTSYSMPASPMKSSLLNGFSSPTMSHKDLTLGTPTTTGSIESFPSYTQVTRPPCLDKSSLYHQYIENFDPTYYKTRKYIPVCKSAPPKALPSYSSKVSKYNDSPQKLLRNELKYCVQERKRALGLLCGGSGGSGSVYGSSPRPHRSSESDLNALLHLYSFPPDPVLDQLPPPGVPNYQAVPQYVLRRNASYPSVEWRSMASDGGRSSFSSSSSAHRTPFSFEGTSRCYY